MSLIADLKVRLGALVFRGHQERQLEEELRFHLDREAAERVRHGADPGVTQREARLAFGGVERYKEEVRDARGVATFEHVAADLRYAVRALWRNPGFTAAAVLVLGVAIGASAAVFAVTDAVLLSELPYPRAERLVRVFNQNSPTNIWSLSVADVQAIRDQQRTLDAFGALAIGSAALGGVRQPETITTGRVTSGFFDALGVRAAKGRLVRADDERADAPPVAVVSDALTSRLLGGATAALGRSITLDGVSHTIVGVLPPGVNDLTGWPASAWTAFVMRPPTRRGPFGIRGFGRLRDGVTLDAAAADLAGISRRIFPLWAAGFPDTTAKFTPLPLRDVIVGTADRQIGLFAAAVVLVLLVAIANVATLLLVRASAREQELSVRVALGAGRRRLAQLVASEGAVLTVLAGLAGLGIAWLGVRFVTVVGPNLPRITEVTLGARGAAAVALLAVFSGVLVSVSPVAAALTGRRSGSLRTDSHRTGTSRRTNAVRGTLVVAEFALALPLLLGAGLLLNSFLRLQRVDPGFDVRGAISVSISLPTARYPDDEAVQRFWRQALARATAVPVLSDAGLTTGLPPDTQGETNNFNLVEKPVPAGTAEPVAPWSLANAGYFTTMGIPLLEGRLFTEADSGEAPPVVVVSRTWAAKYFPGESAVGKRLISGGCYDCPRTTVVGVVGDVKYNGMAGDGDGVYEPVMQGRPRGMSLVARSRVAPGAALAALRGQLSAIDPELPIGQSILADRVQASLGDPRRWTTMLASFAGAAVVLAALGVFGLMSYSVRQRRREIGVRLALGAEPATVTRMIVGRGMRYAVVGTAIGFAVSLLEARWLESLLYGVKASDPMTLMASALVLLLAALAASWLPGWRASRIHPVEAIQAD